MIDIVIPFISGSKNSLELRYALRSMEKNLRFDFRVWLFGERPDWIKNVRYVYVQREPRKIYAKFNDQLRKIQMASEHKDISERFIYTYDDIYFVRPVSFESLDVVRANDNMALIPEKHWFRFSGAQANWVKLSRETLALCREVGAPIYNYETHLPRVYEKWMASTLFNRVGFPDKIFQFATMYFNYFCEEPDEMIQDTGFKGGIYKPMSLLRMAKIAQGCSVLNIMQLWDNSEQLLSRMFPEKSRFEQ